MAQSLKRGGGSEGGGGVRPPLPRGDAELLSKTPGEAQLWGPGAYPESRPGLALRSAPPRLGRGQCVWRVSRTSTSSSPFACLPPSGARGLPVLPVLPLPSFPLVRCARGGHGFEKGDLSGQPRRASTQAPPAAVWCVAQGRGGGRGCIRREEASEAVPEAVWQAVGGGCRSGWGRLQSVTNAVEAGTCSQGPTRGRGRRSPLFKPPPRCRNQRASVALQARGVVRGLLPGALPRESVSATFPPARVGRPRNQEPPKLGGGGVFCQAIMGADGPHGTDLGT